MKLLILYRSYGNTVHDFRQYFFDEFSKYCETVYFDMDCRANRHIGSFDLLLDRACPDSKPDAVFIFTIGKVGYIKGMENFKGPIVLYECDSESYRGKVIDYLNTYKNIRLLALEFHPDCEFDYPVEHKIWTPPAVTPQDYIRETERIYDFGHCGNYAMYRGWHKPRIDFVQNVLPTIKSFKMEIRGQRLEDVGMVSQSLNSSKELAEFANQVKIMFACPTRWNWLTHQYFYPIANGCLVVGLKPNGFDQQMIPECLVEVSLGFSDVEEKVKYYLDHEAERNIIIKKAYDFIQQNHTVRNRVEALISKIKEIS